MLALAVGGKDAHEAGESYWVLLVIAWPFALAAVLAHLVLTVSARRTASVWPEGLIILAMTYGLGMALRGLTGRGLAPGFLVVAAIFLAVTMLGWRGVAQLVVRRRAARNSRQRLPG